MGAVFSPRRDSCQCDVLSSFLCCDPSRCRACLPNPTAAGVTHVEIERAIAGMAYNTQRAPGAVIGSGRRGGLRRQT